MHDGDGPELAEGIAEVGEGIRASGGVVIVFAIAGRVVGEHMLGRGHDCGRTSVVDLECVPRAPGSSPRS